MNRILGKYPTTGGCGVEVEAGNEMDNHIERLQEREPRNHSISQMRRRGGGGKVVTCSPGRKNLKGKVFSLTNLSCLLKINVCNKTESYKNMSMSAAFCTHQSYHYHCISDMKNKASMFAPCSIAVIAIKWMKSLVVEIMAFLILTADLVDSGLKKSKQISQYFHVQWTMLQYGSKITDFNDNYFCILLLLGHIFYQFSISHTKLR